MGQTLLVCKYVLREKFDHETYSGKNDILALVVSGSFQVDDGSGMQVVKPMEAVCFREGKTYHRKVLEPVALYLFRYPGGSNILPSGKLTFQDTQRIASTVRLLQSVDASDADGTEFRQALFNDIINQYRLENPRQLPPLAQRDPVISAAVAKIDENLHKKLHLPALAEAAFLSYVQFSRRFKAAMGMTVQTYISEMRLKKAKQLLSDSDISIKEIARSCGFANEYYFSNFFKAHQNTSPTEFRTLTKTTEKL
ncbi:MAG: helix-turn-helix transcriptional regulator [Oscillospiraceae bacterium]|nr:helix-turn-helix transcriptional regulator [Oscillospiraceae bacterium]